MAESQVTKPILTNPLSAAAFFLFLFAFLVGFRSVRQVGTVGVEKEPGHALVLPAVLPRMGVPPEWAMNARD